MNVHEPTIPSRCTQSRPISMLLCTALTNNRLEIMVHAKPSYVYLLPGCYPANQLLDTWKEKIEKRIQHVPVCLSKICIYKKNMDRERESHLLALDMARNDRQNKTEKNLPSLVARFVFPGLTASPDTLCWVWNHFENSSLRSVQGGYGTSTPTDSTSKPLPTVNSS